METDIKKRINLNCPINSLSYGIVSYNILKALNHNVDVTLFPIGGIQPDDDKDQNLLLTLWEQNKNADLNATCLRIYHQFSMAESIGRGPRVGFPIFELDKFTKREINHLSSLDYIFVCSEWAKNIILKEIGRNEYYVKTVPLGVDRSIFNENIQANFNSNDTVFLNIGKWEIRKGHDLILDAFNKTFSPTDDVSLVMHCACPFDKNRTKQWTEYYKNSKMGEKIFFVEERTPSQRYIASLIKSAHCCVFPARAEGWCLPLLESMSIGKPVITTNYSGQTEFANKDNAMLIDVDDFEMAYDPPWFKGETGRWAKFGTKQLDQLCGYMSNIHKVRKASGQVVLNIAGIETAKRFSWENTANKILEVL